MTVKGIKRRFQKLGNRIKPIFQWFAKIPYRIRRYYNRKKIKSRDFTIISNNCWAGKVYQYLDMPYLSPTVGLYFFSDDYLKFVSNLRYYMSLELSFITIEGSRYQETLIERGRICPIGVLDDVEIVFLHYKSEQEAKEKWDRRKARINWDHLIFKFSKMNLCSEEHMKSFAELPYENKILLNNRKQTVYPCELFWNGPANEKEIKSDTDPFPGNLKLCKMIHWNNWYGTAS